MKGSGIPVIGMRPMVMPAFWNVLKAMNVKTPMHRSLPKSSRASCPARSTRHATKPSSARTPTAPTKPSCSPTAVKMKSVCCSGT